MKKINVPYVENKNHCTQHYTVGILDLTESEEQKKKKKAHLKREERKVSKVFSRLSSVLMVGRRVQVSSNDERKENRRGGGEEPLVLMKVYFLSTLLVPCPLLLFLLKNNFRLSTMLAFHFLGLFSLFFFGVFSLLLELALLSPPLCRDGVINEKGFAPFYSSVGGWAFFLLFFSSFFSPRTHAWLCFCSAHESNTI